MLGWLFSLAIFVNMIDSFLKSSDKLKLISKFFDFKKKINNL